MDVSPSRGNNRSFGELMADLDDRFTLNCEKEFPSSISKGKLAIILHGGKPIAFIIFIHVYQTDVQREVTP